MTQEALKLALDALQRLACLGNGQSYGNSVGNDIAINAITAIKEALAQEQTPVAWKLPDKNVVFWEDTKEVDEYHGFKPTIPLYPHPQRTWVDLTRTQMQDVYFAVLEEHRGGHQMQGQLAFGEALQAKLKERNT